MKKTLLFLSASAAIAADLIPSDRLANWTPASTVGVIGGIPERSNPANIVNVVDYGADTNGVTNAYSAAVAAFAACPSDGVVYFPAGTYAWQGALAIPSNKTLRGAGMSNVTINLTGAYFVVIGTEVDWDWGNVWPHSPTNGIIGGFEKGASNITTVASIPESYVGGLVRMSQSNNTPWVLHPDGWQYLQNWGATITAISSGTNVTFWPPRPWAMIEARSPILYAHLKANIITNAGVEGLTVNALNQGTSGYGIIRFSEARNCWVKDVKIKSPIDYGIFNELISVNCELRRVWIDTIQSDGSNKGGLLLYRHAFGWLVEDSIFYKCQPSIEVNGGSSGNAFLYNYCVESGGRGGYPFNAIDGNHGAHNCYNLYEGNKSSGYVDDGYFGSVSHNTLFRNCLFPTNSLSSKNLSGIRMCRYSYSNSIAGNVVGGPGLSWTYSTDGVNDGSYSVHYCYSFGYPSIGNWFISDGTGYDANVLATVLLKQNYDYATLGIPVAQQSSDTLSNSLAYASTPSWWSNGKAWPPYGPYQPTNTIPAEDRFFGIASPVATQSATAIMRGAAIMKGAVIQR